MGDTATSTETVDTAETADNPTLGTRPGSTETVDTTETVVTEPTEFEHLPENHPVLVALRKANDKARAAEAKVKSFEDRDKSELELANETVANEQNAREAAENELRRYRAAVKYRLSDEDLDLLGTGTDEEIDARAKRLGELANAAGSAPKPNPVVGQATESAGSIDEQIAAAQKAGDVTRVIHLQNQKLART